MIARGWHALTAVVALVALVVQVVLVASGEAVLVEASLAPPVHVRLFRFCCYFTVQSNLLVLLTCASLALDPARDGRLWRVARLDAVVGITVTGVIHWFFLRPLLDLDGASYVTDKLLHLAVPLLAVAGWVALGPRGRIDPVTLRWALAWPAAYMAFTLVHGGASGWYPYPFTDVGDLGYARVLLNALGVVALLLAVALGLRRADDALDRRGATAGRG